MIQTQLILLLVLSVIAGAMADGFNENNHKNIGHPVEALEKVLLLVAGVVSHSWIIIFPYTAFRIALFDYTKNLTKGQPLLYLGDSNWWDRFLKKQQPLGVIFGRIIFLTFAISFTILEF